MNNLTDAQINYFKAHNKRLSGGIIPPHTDGNDSDFIIKCGEPYDADGFQYIDVFAYDKVSRKSYLLCSPSATNSYEALSVSIKAFDSFLTSGRKIAIINNGLRLSETAIIEYLLNDHLKVLDWNGSPTYRDGIKRFWIEVSVGDGVKNSLLMVYDPYLINVITQGVYGNMETIKVIVDGSERSVMRQAAIFGYVERIDMDSEFYQVVAGHQNTLEEGKFYVDETFVLPSGDYKLVLTEEYEQDEDKFKDIFAYHNEKPHLLYTAFAQGGEYTQERLNHILTSWSKNDYKFFVWEGEYDITPEELLSSIVKCDISIGGITEVRFCQLGCTGSVHKVSIYDVAKAEHFVLHVYDEKLLNAIKHQNETMIQQSIKILEEAGYTVSKNKVSA